jgi:hypothetical protein
VRLDSILQIGRAAVFAIQSVKATFVNGGFGSVKRISGQPHNTTGLGHIAQFFCQV